MKVAIVHDFLTKLGGAEYTLGVIHEIFPNAPIYTLLYDKVGTKGRFEHDDYKIITSKLQKLPKFIRNKNKLLLPYYPQAIEEFDLSEFDLVISSSNSFAHGIITRPKTLHITYCYSPIRYAWDWTHKYFIENKLGFGPIGFFARKIISKLRIWDYHASNRSDSFIAISKTVANRISKYYRRNSTVIYPPVELEKYLNNDKKPDDFYLIVSRLSPYKNINLAIRACNKLGKKLYIIGEGSDRKRLEKIAGPTIKFLGWLPDNKKIDYFKKCRAFIFPGEDDFGITPVEAMAAGRPVVALGAGGALETVVAGKTGEFFADDNIKSLADTIKKLENNYSKYSVLECQNQSKKFSKEIFKEKFQEYIEKKIQK